MAGFIVTEAVGVIWMFMMFAVVRWVAKKLRRPDPPALIVALTAYVVTVLLGVGVLGSAPQGWSRWSNPTLWKLWATLSIVPTVLTVMIDGALQRWGNRDENAPTLTATNTAPPPQAPPQTPSQT